MQKRTNPLALKGTPKEESPIRGVLPIERGETTPRSGASEPAATPKNGMRTKKVSDFAPPKVVPTTEQKKTTPPVFVPTFTRSSMDQPIMKPPMTPAAPKEPMPPARAAAPAAYSISRPVPTPVVEDEELMEEVLGSEPLMAEPYGEEEIALYDEGEVLTPTATAKTPAVPAEEEFPTMEDYRRAVRFALRGHVSRKMVLPRISRDVCRLAQLMHPEQSLSTILENALMTRIFLEDPEAFDAMASVIEEKGGRIKC